MANRDRSGDAGAWPYRFDERDGSVDRYGGGTRGNARDDYRGSGAYGGSFTAGGRAGAGYGGGYYGYQHRSADPGTQAERMSREHRPGFVSGWGGNVEGYGRGGALDYGYGGMNVGGRDRDWGLADVPHLPNERYGGRWAESREDERGGYGEGSLGGPRRPMMGGGYGGAQTRGGQGMAEGGYGMLSGADYGRSWGGPPGAGGGAAGYARTDHTGQGPRGYRRSDVRINEDVCDALMDEPELDASDIEVRVEGGEVTLTGTVSDRRAKRLAEDVADTVRGVWDVQNRLRIRREGSEAPATTAAGEREVTPEPIDEAPPSEGRRKRR